MLLPHAWQKWSHWPFVPITLVALILVLTGLGRDHLWADEGDTAVLATNITKYGLPMAWDGTTFVDSDRGARLNHDLVMTSSPWLQYYVTAGALFLFGKNAFSARIPFAIAGWLTVLLSYGLILRLTASRWAAFCTASILIGSVQFLLYCRQCRYYALSMLLTVLLVQIFLKMKSFTDGALFALIAIALFHTHPLASVPVVALGILTITYRPFWPQRHFFWVMAPFIAALTLPWIAFAGSGYAESMGSVQSLPQFAGRVVQYLIECASVTPLIGAIVLTLISVARRRGNTDAAVSDFGFVDKRDNAIVTITFATLLLNAIVIAATQPADSLWRIGIRYTAAMFPLIAMVIGIYVVKVANGRIIPILSLLAFVIFTKFGQLTPWIFWEKKVATFDGKEVIEAHFPDNTVERFLNTRQQLVFISDLFHSNPGTVASISNFLRDHAQPDDKIITNYEWEPLYFHTGLPQALKILPGYPIYQDAKSKGLPDYVFDVDQARWVIWRPVWDGYQEYFAGTVQEEIVKRGGHIELVAEVPETLWENRENIHFHRFSGGRYLFHGPESFPPASVFRVSWPDSMTN